MSDINLKRIKNEPHLRKDQGSGAVVNISTDEYYKYLERKEIARKNNGRLECVESELSEVKDLLRSIIEKLEQ